MMQDPLPTQHPQATGHGIDTPDAIVNRGPFASRATERSSTAVGAVWGYVFLAALIMLAVIVGASLAELWHQTAGWR